MKIGYQGITGSNSHKAAMKLVELAQLEDVEYIGLVTSREVVEALENNGVDYGVLATENSKAGIVIETKEALENKEIEVVSSYTLAIRHCLYALHTRLEDITTVASHIQALKQCEQTMNELIPNVILQEEKDTALSAVYLKEGRFSENVAVLCTHEAGKYNDLMLIKENVQDATDNCTHFILIRSK